MIVVAGDIGGTKVLLTAVELDGAGEGRGLLEERYPTDAFPGFEPMLQDFVRKLAGPVECVSLGVAGAIVDGVVHGTNLPWGLDEAGIRSASGIQRVKLLNDFAATAVGVLELVAGDIVTLQPGECDQAGPVGILGAGTGLGEASLVPREGRYVVVPTEGGHADFAARTDEEIELLKSLRAKFGRVSWERLLSGPGIANLYEFVRSRSPQRETAAVVAAIAAGDTAAAVTEHDAKGDPLCREAIDLFLGIYGAEAGNVALRTVATRGVYVAGGIAPRMVERFRDGRFMAAFRAKGRHTPLVARMPVHLVTNTRVGLLGALRVARELARGERTAA